MRNVLCGLHVTNGFVSLSGLVVASRLTEDPGVAVAVIEAGPNAENLPEVSEDYLILIYRHWPNCCTGFHPRSHRDRADFHHPRLELSNRSSTGS